MSVNKVAVSTEILSIISLSPGGDTATSSQVLGVVPPLHSFLKPPAHLRSPNHTCPSALLDHFSATSLYHPTPAVRHPDVSPLLHFLTCRLFLVMNHGGS